MKKFKQPSQSQKGKYAKYLSPDEEILIITGISNVYFWSQFLRLVTPSFFTFGLALLFFRLESQIIGAALLILGAIFLTLVTAGLVRLIRKKQSFHYVLTNKRCLIVQGVFSRKLITAPLAAITHVTVEQSLTERFFYRCGQIVVITAGYDPREIVIEHIAHPIEFKVLMEQLTSQLDHEKPPVEKSSNLQMPLRHLKLS